MLDMSGRTLYRKTFDAPMSVSKLLSCVLYSAVAVTVCWFKVCTLRFQPAYAVGWLYCLHQCLTVALLHARRRELFCDFCNSRLPEWKNVLTPSCGATAPAVMNVNFDNKTYSFQVAPGPDGYKQFTEAIRKAFRLPDDSELNITFTCDEPSSGRDGEVMVPLPLHEHCMTQLFDTLPKPCDSCRTNSLCLWHYPTTVMHP